MGLLTLVAYGQAIFYPFVHDDLAFIAENPRIRNFDLQFILFEPSVPGWNITLANTYYRPFLEVLYRLQFKAFGENPLGYHLFNIVLHIFNSWLVYMLLAHIFQKKKEYALAGRLPAGGGAVVFLLHPIQTETVVCVSGVSNLMFVSFSLISLLCYIHSANGQNRKWHICSLFAFFLALLSKEHAVVLIGLIFLYELILSTSVEKEKNFSWVFPILWFTALLGVYFLIRQIFLGTALGGQLVFNEEMKLRVLAIPRTVLTYLQLVFFPVGLHYYRHIDILQSNISSWIIISMLISILGFLLYQAQREERKVMIFGLFWFLVAMAPVLNILPLISEYSFILTSEHFLYFPLIGLVVFLVGLVEMCRRKINHPSLHRIGRYIFILLCLVLAVLTTRQTTYWRNEVVLFERTMIFEKEFGRGYDLLTKAYLKSKNFPKAVQSATKGITIFLGYANKVENPQIKEFYLRFASGLYKDLGIAQRSLGQLQEAVQSYERAYQYHGEWRNDSAKKEILFLMGSAHMELGAYPRAIPYLKEVIAIDNKNPDIWNNLGVVYIETGKKNEAKEIFEYILKEINPEYVPAQNNLKRLLSENNDK